MARRKSEVYEVQAETTSISARVKLTLKVRDNFISVEGNEERTVPQNVRVNMGKEWEALWASVYATCDEEIANILQDMKTGKSK